jgi:hypothetical protein
MPLSLSSSDWTRIQRLKAASIYGRPTTGTVATNEDVTNPLTTPNSPGTSKTRREASKWTDYVASRNQDYTLKSSNYSTPSFIGTRNTLVKLNCNCGTITGANTSVPNSKLAGCSKCNLAQHLRM